MSRLFTGCSRPGWLQCLAPCFSTGNALGGTGQAGGLWEQRGAAEYLSPPWQASRVGTGAASTSLSRMTQWHARRAASPMAGTSTASM